MLIHWVYISIKRTTLMKIMKTSPEYYTIAYLHILPKVAACRLKNICYLTFSFSGRFDHFNIFYRMPTTPKGLNWNLNKVSKLSLRGTCMGKSHYRWKALAICVNAEAASKRKCVCHCNIISQKIKSLPPKEWFPKISLTTSFKANTSIKFPNKILFFLLIKVAVTESF